VTVDCVSAVAELLVFNFFMLQDRIAIYVVFQYNKLYNRSTHKHKSK